MNYVIGSSDVWSLLCTVVVLNLVIETNAAGGRKDFASESRRRATPPLVAANRNATSVRRAHAGEYGWVFTRYLSSDLEKNFFEDVKPFVRKVSWMPLVQKYSDNISALLHMQRGRVVPDRPMLKQTDQFASECNVYLEVSSATASSPTDGRVGCLGNTSEMDAYIFSRFEYTFVCLAPPCEKPPPAGRRVGDVHTSYIEPLFGYLRHPGNFQRDGWASQRTLLRKEYMLVDKWALNHLYTRWQHKKRESLYFDLGASTWLTGGGGSSQNWFVGMSECLCIPFTELRLWEARPQTIADVWNTLPDHLQPHYFWYNYPLSVRLDSWRNPLNHLLERLRDDDGLTAVTIKIDFDSPYLERKIIDTIVQFPQLHSNIDELFFEHHVRFGRMVKHWKSGVEKRSTILHSIQLFLSMRRLGIRAHSWV